MARLTAALLFLLLCVVGLVTANTLCTVGGAGADFATIQGALDGCNGGSGDIELRINVTVGYIGPLIFPEDLRTVIMEPASPGRIVIYGAGHFVDPIYSQLSLFLTNITFDGLNSQLALFEPRLTNTNFSCVQCFYRQFNGSYVYRQESCSDSTQITFINNVWLERGSNAVEIYAAESIRFEENVCARCTGNPNVSFGSLFFFHIHEISRGSFIMSFNAQWRLFDAQPLRCRWYLDTEANVRCNQIDEIDGLAVMELQCFDRIATEDAGFCQIGTQTLPNPLGGENVTSVEIVNDYLPLCRNYRRCTCNAVEFVADINGTEISIERAIGDVFYGGRQVPEDTLLQCTPLGPSSVNGTFTCSEVFNQYSDDLEDATDCFNAFSAGVIAAEGEIENPCVCPPEDERFAAAQDVRDPIEYPCRYSNDEGIVCEEGTPFCCVEPYWTYADARYYVRTCASAESISRTTTVELLVNFTTLIVYVNPEYNSTHFYTQLTLINLNGVFGPVDGIFAHNSAPAFFLDGESVIVDASLGFFNPVGNMASVTAVLENQPVSANGQLLVDDIVDQWLYTYSGYGKMENDVVVALGVYSCVDHEETVAAITGFLVDPSDGYSGQIDVFLISSVTSLGSLRLIFEDEWNSTDFTRVQLFLNGAGTLIDQIFIDPPGSGVLNYGSGETINVLLDVDTSGLFDSHFVELNISLPGETQTLDHRWQHDPTLFVLGGQLLVRTQFGLWYEKNEFTSAALPVFDYFANVERIPVFFDRVLQIGCGAGVDSPDCYFFNDCASVNCDQTVTDCAVYSCYELFTATALAVDPAVNITTDLEIGDPYRNGTVVALGYDGRIEFNGTVLNNGTLVNITWSYRTYPLAPNALNLPSIDVLAQCQLVNPAVVFNSTNGTTFAPGTYEYDAGWLFRPDGRWNPDLMDLVSMENWLDPGTWPAPSGVPLVHLEEPLNRVATECCTGLYRECSCATVDPSGGSQNLTAPYWFNSTYECRADLTNTTVEPWCDCSNDVLTTLFPPYNDTVVYYIAQLPPTLSFVQMIENRAQQLAYGAYFQDTPYELIDEFSFAQPKRWDRYGTLREFYDNDNEFVTGSVHDLIQNPPPVPLRFPGDVIQLDSFLFCDNGCPIFFITEEEFTCLVDKEATPDVTGWGVTVFENITDAVARAAQGGCRGAPGSGRNRTILTRYTEQYYDETIDLTRDARNTYFGSLDSARVVGSAHEIDGRVDTLTFQGMQFVHARENKKPLFIIRFRTLNQLNYLNVDFFGEQVRAGGIVGGRAEYINIEASSFHDFEQYALRVDETALGVRVEDSQVFDSVGRVFFFKFDLYLQLVNIDYNEVRGGADYKEAAIVSARARSGQACQEWANDDPNSLERADEPNICKIIGNRQHISIFDEDQRDQCFWLDRGFWNAHRIRNNKCIKAQFGFTGSRIESWSPDGVNGFSDIRGGTLEWFSIYNPLVQPSIFRNETRAKLYGWDYRLRSPVPRSGLNGNDVLNFFVSGRNSERNFGDLDENRMARDSPLDYRWGIDTLWFGSGVNGSQIRCEVNNNYDDEYMRFRATFPEYPDVYFVHGFHNFHNVSLAALFCTDGRVLRGEAPSVFVTSYNGSFIRQDNITLGRDAWLIGDTSNPDSWCRIEDGRWPVIAGHDHRAAAPNINMTLLAYWLDFYEDLGQTEIWRSFNVPQEWMILDRVLFDGRNKIPRSEARVYDFDCGQIVELPLDSAGEIRTNRPIPPSKCLFEFYEVIHQNFIDFEGRTVNEITGEVEVVTQFPYTDGGRIRCLNAFNADTTVFIQNCTWKDMDREALYIENCLRTYVVDSQFYNISGRSRGNRQAVYIEGNPNNNTLGYPLLYFVNNVGIQEKDLLFPRTINTMNPVETTMYWFQGFPNNTLFCFKNNVASGLRVGARFAAMQRSLLTTCLPENATVPFFPDRKRELRSLCVYGNNSNVKGSWHDMVWDLEPGTQDRWRNNEWCDSCCPLEDPDICYVDAIPEMCVPENPWYDRFFFCSINRAITHCVAPIPYIYVIGRQNIFGWFPEDIRGPIGNEWRDFEVDYPVPFKTYCEQIDAQPGPRYFFFNLLNVSGNYTYNETIIDTSRITVGGAWGHQVCARGHAADLSRNVTITFEGLNFTHCDETCTPGPIVGGVSTWFQPPGYNSSGLKIRRCLFNGAESDVRPHNGVFDSGFLLEDSKTFNYSGNFGSRIVGRDCDPDTLVSVIGNDWRGFAGEAFYGGLAGSYVFDGNRFIDSGGKVPSSDWVAYVTQCDDAQPGVYSVRNNRFYEIYQTAFGSTLKTALWLGDVYLQTKKWIIKRNCIDETIDVAIRYENMPGSDRALLSSFMLDPNDQLCADGTAFDTIEGPPSNDPLLVSDPQGQRQHWCNDGCAPRDWFGLGIIFGIAFILALITLLLVLYFCFPSFWNRGARMVYSRFLRMEVPLNRHDMIKPDQVQWHQPDPGFEPQVLPPTSEVAPGLAVAQNTVDGNQGGWWLPRDDQQAARIAGEVKTSTGPDLDYSALFPTDDTIRRRT